ncbi:MAG: hypothetical protein QY332_14710 [Anaerolineales bacterium]|nr:MAG: hypothetical protein QY332_14710 [Anaerolineales bacterium]
MARTSPPITIEETPGADFPDLGAAQRSARSMLAVDLAQMIRRMIDQGVLEIADNKIRPKGKCA